MEATAAQQLSIFDTAARTPLEIDTELAALYVEANKVAQRIEMAAGSIKGAAGARYYYKGRRRVTDMTLAEARTIVEAALAAQDGDSYATLNSYTIRHFDRPSMIEQFDALLAEHAALRAEMVKVEREYTGWSRFFLVTSSAGHIHSSTGCSTCRPTTTYGWMPNLSGQTEAEAVEECGPTLCSVCFPTAPVEWTAGRLTKAQAESKAA